jgi:DNA-binding MarR family transcriptional regulator
MRAALGSDAAIDATGRIMDALRRVVRALRTANSDARRKLGVGAAQIFVLRQIADHPGLGLAELATRTHTAQSSVSEVVSSLVAAGLVTRVASVEDRRCASLTLTAAGCALVERAATSLQERLIGALERLTDGDRTRLAQALESWLAAAGLEGLPPSMFFAQDHELPEPSHV